MGRLWLAGLPVLALVAAACRGNIGFVSQEKYERDLTAAQQRIVELEETRVAYERLQAEHAHTVQELERLRGRHDAYAEISSHLREFLSGIQGVVRNPDGSWSFEVDLLFRPGSYEISEAGRETLRRFCSAWKDRPVRFRIAGHADKDPVRASAERTPILGAGDAANHELAANRAIAVMGEFVRNGISPRRIVVESHGNNSPRAPNDDRPENKRRNRRVEVYVLRE